MSLRFALGKVRILWRDIIIRASDLTVYLDDFMNAYFFPDTSYQYMWSSLDVHRTMLKDDVRLDAFQKALEETVKEGDVVLDIGTGTGVLAMLAAKAGAKKAYGVDSASIIDVAKRAAAKTGLDNVEFIRSDIRDIDVEMVDLIVCELIGIHITDEGMTYKIEKALKFLKDGGKLMPSEIDIFFAPVQSDDAGIGFWKKMRGIDFSVVDKVPHEPRNYDMTACKFLAEPIKIAEIRMSETDNPQIKKTGEFTCTRDGCFHGGVLYFDAKLSEHVTLSTDPRKELTHWKQVFLPADSKNDVKKGDKIAFDIHCVYNNTKWRWKFGKN